jgi:ABC-type transport system involved in cytochrome c biogenesis ATPase subunit
MVPLDQSLYKRIQLISVGEQRLVALLRLLLSRQGVLQQVAMGIEDVQLL